jgi:hypothetical protein
MLGLGLRAARRAGERLGTREELLGKIGCSLPSAIFKPRARATLLKQRRVMIRFQEQMSLRRQCELLAVGRSGCTTNQWALGEMTIGRQFCSSVSAPLSRRRRNAPKTGRTMHGARRLPRPRSMSLSDCPSFHRFQSSYLCTVFIPRFALATRYAFYGAVQHQPLLRPIESGTHFFNYVALPLQLF